MRCRSTASVAGAAADWTRPVSSSQPRTLFGPEPAAGAAEQLARSDCLRLVGQSGLWPAVLPKLRDRAGLKRSELVERLAGLLGVSDRAEKVARYYHEMEQGLLPEQGVSQRVLEALSQIVGGSAEALREAGRALHRPHVGPTPGQPAFARRAHVEPAAAPAAAAPLGGDEEVDEVDALFRGG